MTHESESVLVWIGQGLVLLARHFDHFHKRQEEIQMDTKKLLEAVEREKTEKSSLLELSRGQTRALQDASTKIGEMSDQIRDLSSKLDQMGSGQGGGQDQQKDEQIKALQDQVAQLQSSATEAQAEIDKAADELDADNEDVQAAISANVQTGGQAGQAQQSGGGDSQASNSSSSSSTGSGGGGGQKPSPLAGTGAPQSSESQSSQQQDGASSQQQSAANAPVDTPALAGSIADPNKPGSMPPPEDADAAGQTAQRALGSDPVASQAPKSGA